MILLILAFLALAVISVNHGVLPGFENSLTEGFHGHRIWEKRYQRRLGLNHPYRNKKNRRGYPYHHFWKYRTTSPEMANYVNLNNPPYSLANWYSWDSLRRQGIQGTPWWAHYYRYHD